MSELEGLPEHVLQVMMKQVQPRDVKSLLATCRRFWRRISRNRSLWLHWCSSHWPSLFASISFDIDDEPVMPDGCTYRWLFGCLSNEVASLNSSKFSGLGTLCDQTRLYVGEWKNGKYEGKGILHKKIQNTIYCGEWKEGESCGKGSYSSLSFKSSGQWLHDKLNGCGVEVYLKKFQDKDEKYEGEFLNGKRSGSGCYSYWNGDRYEGSWLEDSKTGLGSYIWASGAKFIGHFVENDREGHGKFIWPNGEMREGEWEADKPKQAAEWLHPAIKQAIQANVCTGVVPGLRCNLGQMYYECQTCGGRVCVVCRVTCHSSHPSSLPTWSSLNNCQCPCFKDPSSLCLPS